MKKKISLVLAMFSLLTIWLMLDSGQYYKTYSPDGQYSVYASKYNYSMFIPGMPGQGGDSPGRVYLFDERELRILGEADIFMISMASSVQWATDHAYIVGNYGVEWNLPRPISPSSKVQ